MHKFMIHEDKLSEFKTKIEKLNKRAKKLNLPEVKYEIGRGEKRKYKHSHMVYFVYEVSVDHSDIVINGYRLTAKIKHLPGGAIMQHTYNPNDSQPDWKAMFPHTYCMHCKTNRLRNNLYVIQHNETKVYSQIGSTCVDDFFGNGDAVTIASYLEYLSELGNEDPDEYAERYPRTSNIYTTDDVLNAALTHLEENGYVSKRDAEGSTTKVATVARVTEMLYSGEQIKKYNLDEVREWLNVKVSTMKGNDFVYNLTSQLGVEFISLLHIGCLVYAAQMWKMRNSDTVNGINQHFGKLGEKVTITGTVKRVISSCGYYGTTNGIFIETENGLAVTWTSSSNLVNYCKQNANVTIKGTIKEHTVYNGTKQTVLKNCKEA